MRISKKTTYGMSFMLRLAISYGDTYIKLKDIAKSEKIPEKYLENIVSIIKSTDLIEVKRGAEGGYKLSRSPDHIKLKDIYEVLSGSIPEQESSINGSFNITTNKQVIVDLWKELRLRLTEYLEVRTLEDLANNYKKKYNDQMFYDL